MFKSLKLVQQVGHIRHHSLLDHRQYPQRLKYATWCPIDMFFQEWICSFGGFFPAKNFSP